MAAVPLRRTLAPKKPELYGVDVEGVGRALCRAEVLMPIALFHRASVAWKRTYGQRKVDAVNRIRKGEGWRQTGVYDDRVHQLLVDAGAFDALAVKLMQAWKPPPVLTDADRIRMAITDFCERAEAARQLWHYTQRRPYTGKGITPEQVHYNDCSSYAILAYYWARQVTGLAVPDPSGYKYAGWGNTWDDLDGHTRVTGFYLVGDLAHYNGHVTICRKQGGADTAWWSSFGREEGPEQTRLHYRRDLRFVVRPPLR